MKTKLKKTGEDDNFIYCHGIKIDKRNKLSDGSFHIEANEFIQQMGIDITPVELLTSKYITNGHKQIKKRN